MLSIKFTLFIKQINYFIFHISDQNLSALHPVQGKNISEISWYSCEDVTCCFLCQCKKLAAAFQFESADANFWH